MHKKVEPKKYVRFRSIKDKLQGNKQIYFSVKLCLLHNFVTFDEIFADNFVIDANPMKKKQRARKVKKKFAYTSHIFIYILYYIYHSKSYLIVPNQKYKQRKNNYKLIIE